MAKRQRKKPKKRTLRQLDGSLCLSFVNTGSAKRRAPRDYAGLLLWLESQGALGAGEASRFRALAAQDPEPAGEAFDTAAQLRDLLGEIFNEAVDHRRVTPIRMDAFNVYVTAILPRQQLVPFSGARFRWDWVPGREDDLGRPLWAVIGSAAKLLASADVARVRRCAGEDCDLLFLARNSGSPRRWCSMNACGSRVSSRRHYHKTKKPRQQAWEKLSPAEQKRKIEEAEPLHFQTFQEAGDDERSG